jgi:hypothetical protein
MLQKQVQKISTNKGIMKFMDHSKTKLISTDSKKY